MSVLRVSRRRLTSLLRTLQRCQSSAPESGAPTRPAEKSPSRSVGVAWLLNREPPFDCPELLVPSLTSLCLGLSAPQTWDLHSSIQSVSISVSTKNAQRPLFLSSTLQLYGAQRHCNLTFSTWQFQDHTVVSLGDRDREESVSPGTVRKIT